MSRTKYCATIVLGPMLLVRMRMILPRATTTTTITRHRRRRWRVDRFGFDTIINRHAFRRASIAARRGSLNFNSCRNCSIILSMSATTRLLVPTLPLAKMQQADAFLQQAPPETVSPHLVESRNAAVQRMRRQLLQSTAASLCRLNWGVVAVYTCPHSCSTSADNVSNDNAQERESSFSSLGAYREEFAWVQPSIDSSQ
jgi:hypothetical protein